MRSTALRASAAGAKVLFAALFASSIGGGPGRAGDDLTSSRQVPEIVAHPVDMPVSEGQRTTFTVVAKGRKPLSYQWLCEGLEIPHATSPYYTTPPASLADSGSRFTCVVRNADGIAVSRTATLIVKMTSVVALAGGREHVVALRSDGTVWAWGCNELGQLGDGTKTNRFTPVQVKGPGGEGFLTDVKAVAAGSISSFAVKKDGTVWAWGGSCRGAFGDGTDNNETSTPIQVKGPGGEGFLTDVEAIAVSGVRALALRRDGTVWAWGNNEAGQGGDGTTTARLVPVQVRGPGGEGFLTDIKAIAAGEVHSLALKRDGTVWAWGENADGQLGDGTRTNRLTPVQVKGPYGKGFLTDIKAIAAGYSHSLALRADGTVWAWGFGAEGRLGNGSWNDSLTPIQVKGPYGKGFLTDIKAIAAGYGHSLALRTDGTVWAWGWNGSGLLGDGTTKGKSVPVQVKGQDGEGFLTDVQFIAAGMDYSAAIQVGGTVWAWGHNEVGQLGDGRRMETPVPVQVQGPGGTGFLTCAKAIAAGESHSFALMADGTVLGWGGNLCAQLGLGGRSVRHFTPDTVKYSKDKKPLKDVNAIATGRRHSFAIRSDGTLWAWGFNYRGQLGDGTTNESLLPVQVKGPEGTGFLVNVRAVAGGKEHSIAVDGDGAVWAWGYNATGELGNGTTTGSHTPVRVKLSDGGLLTNVEAVGAGVGYSLALRRDGTVWAWGWNSYGQLGNNTTTDSCVAVQVRDAGGADYFSGVQAIAAGGYHALALKKDGTVWAWGCNESGQLGDGTTMNRSAPVQVKGPGGVGLLAGIRAIAAGKEYSLALRADGAVWAWGKNDYGQLGDGTKTDSSTPVRVRGPSGVGLLTDVQAVAAGGYHALALKKDGTVWAWGCNEFGQLGDGPRPFSLTPR